MRGAMLPLCVRRGEPDAASAAPAAQCGAGSVQVHGVLRKLSMRPAPQLIRTVHRQGETAMNAETFKGQWNQLAGRLRSQWGKLTDDDVQRVNGDLQRLQGVVQERYGIAREEAQMEVERFLDAQESSAKRH
jgi:uncharacterized protein YjbJ (UPF0337 family)